jgi:molybdenum cofactor cytidylyltransferase
MTVQRVTGVVLAAGASSRLGTPKQLLPLGNTTVLGATIDVARRCPFNQIVVTLGGAAASVLQTVSLDGIDVVTADNFAAGCATSLRAALRQVDAAAAGIVLMLGDEPGVQPATVASLIAEATEGPITVCRYSDGIGHPFWLGRTVFGELAQLHGDKGVWKLIESGRVPVRELAIDGPMPIDVDTWDDYARLLATVSR